MTQVLYPRKKLSGPLGVKQRESVCVCVYRSGAGGSSDMFHLIWMYLLKYVTTLEEKTL